MKRQLIRILSIFIALTMMIPVVSGCDNISSKGKNTAMSAYEIAVENGYSGTVDEWLSSLHGTDGKEGSAGKDGADGKNGVDGKDGTDGKNGADGKSAYDIAVDEGYKGNKEEWLISIAGEKGEKGDKGDKGERGYDGEDGRDGKSAYEIAVKNGFVGTEKEWIDSLKGKDGSSGTQGEKGVGVANASVNGEYHLIIELTDGSTIDAGYVGVVPEEVFFTVTFNANGEGVTELPEPQSVKAGACATEPADPKREGYVFDGWYTDAECTELFNFADFIISEKQLYAKWIVAEAVSDIITEALMNIMIGYASGDNYLFVTKDVTLPTSIEIVGVTRKLSVEWSSSNTEVITNDGRVVRGTDTTEVILTATITYGGKTDSKQFTLNVIKENNDTPVICNSINDFSQFDENGLLPDIYMNSDNQITTIDGIISNVEVQSCDDAIKAISGIKDILGIDDPSEELIGVRAGSTEYSRSYALQQMYKGIPVYGRDITVSTDNEGVADYLNNGFLADIDISVEPGMSTESIVEILTENYNNGYTYSADGMVIYSLGSYKSDPVLAYTVNAVSGGRTTEVLYVNADNGEVIFAEPTDRSAVVITATAKDEFGNDRTFNTDFEIEKTEKGTSGKWVMRDNVRNIELYDGAYYDIENNEFPIHSSTDSKWTDPVAVSTFANIAEAYDWYSETFNRNLIAERGAIQVLIHYPWNNDGEYDYEHRKANNASWNGNNTFNFYDINDELVHTYGASLDVVVHEYTHGIFQYSAGDIAYANATGAINEAYADIMACLCTGDWVVGEDSHRTSDGLRNIANPERTDCPDRYLTGQYWKPYTDKPDPDTNDRGGVHTNCTVISHAAYLMNIAGIPMDRLAKLWYESMWKGGFWVAEDFTIVRLNVVTAAKHLGFSDEELDIINDSFDAVNIGIGCSLFGNITVADSDTDMTNNIPLGEAKITIQNDDVIKSTLSCQNGDYRIDGIPYGTYTVTVSKDGYIPVTKTIVFNELIHDEYDAVIEAISTENTGTGTASGYIYNASTGTAIKGLTVNVRSGLNDTSGTVLRTVYTDSNGKYTISDIDAGNYTLEIVDDRTGITDKERYTTASINIKVLGGKTIGNQNGFVSNGLEVGELRIVLSWGKTPEDLDSHLVGPASSGGKFHVYYNNQMHDSANELDHDDTTSYGPETVTIHSEMTGRYVYAIHDYTNRKSVNSKALSGSGAQVKVYRGNQLLYVFNVPINKEGTLWTVFSYDGQTQEFTIIQDMSYVADPKEVLNGQTVVTVNNLLSNSNEEMMYTYYDEKYIIADDIYKNEK